MRLSDANKLLKEIDGREYGYLKAWGLSLIKEAIYTVYHRVHVEKEDRERAEAIEWRIQRGRYDEQGHY